MLVCGDFIYTLEIIASILREVINRERLCGHYAQRGSRSVHVYGVVMTGAVLIVS